MGLRYLIALATPAQADARMHAHQADRVDAVPVSYQKRTEKPGETVGMFLGEALKASTGPENWLRFFALEG